MRLLSWWQRITDRLTGEAPCGWALARQSEAMGHTPVMIAEVDGQIVYLTGRQKPGPFSPFEDWQRHLATLEGLQPQTPAVAAAIEQAKRQVARLETVGTVG